MKSGITLLNAGGEGQVIQYIKGLHSAIAQAAAGVIVWRNLMHPKLPGVYFIRYVLSCPGNSTVGSVLRDDFDPDNSDVDVQAEFNPGCFAGCRI